MNYHTSFVLILLYSNILKVGCNFCYRNEVAKFNGAFGVCKCIFSLSFEANGKPHSDNISIRLIVLLTACIFGSL